MSLTRLLGSPRYPELRAWFLDMFPRIKTIEKQPILVPSNGGSYAGAIGQAFDYMFRFHLERLNPQFVIGEPDWVAETALGQLQKKASLPNADILRIGYHRDGRINAIELANEANASFQVATQPSGSLSAGMAGYLCTGITGSLSTGIFNSPFSQRHGCKGNDEKKV